MSNSIEQLKPSYSLWQLVIYMLKLGTWGFGGPVALAGYMNRDLVEKYGWITEADYKEGTVITQSEIASLVFAAGFITLFVKAPPKWFKGGNLNGLAVTQVPVFTSIWGSFDVSLLSQIAIFFTKAGAFVFGSGLAIVPFLYGGVVVEHQWLTEKQFVDAVAVAMITPGPVVITVGFIGYLIAGFTGASIAALATFVPCYLFTVIPAPYFKKYGKNPSLVAFIDGVTAAAVGAITGSVIVIAQRSIVDIPTAVLAIVTTALLWKYKKLTEPVVVIAAALLGLVLYPIFH